MQWGPTCAARSGLPNHCLCLRKPNGARSNWTAIYAYRAIFDANLIVRLMTMHIGLAAAPNFYVKSPLFLSPIVHSVSLHSFFFQTASHLCCAIVIFPNLTTEGF
eukprot:scaffold39474_cov33-Tisochrysis_lutea.AAC.3